MATKYASTGWEHEDIAVQREFERIAKAFGITDQEVETIQKVINGPNGNNALAGRLWELMVKHNSNKVQVPTEFLDFIDTDDIRFEVQKWKGKEARIRAFLSTAFTANNYNTLFELRENNNYAISAGGIETIDGTTIGAIASQVDQEICNRDPQFIAGSSPQTNNGDGWVPISSDQEVIIDTEGYIQYSNARIYITNPLSWVKNVLFFRPTISGTYKFDISTYVKAVFAPGVGTAFRPYDSIDKGMLIAEKCTDAQIFDSPSFAWHNPILTDYANPNTNPLYLIDTKCRIGDQDFTKNNAILMPYAAVNLVYGDNATGCAMGSMYNPEIHLNGSCEIYLQAGECVMFWYKMYGHRIHISGANYVAYRPAPDNAADYTMFIDQRYERVAVSFIGDNGESTNEDDRTDVRDIVERF